jgi:hypothetical protein
MGDDFFDDLPPFQSHSDTSREAAVSIIGRADTLRRQVYEAIFRAGPHGMTDEELQIDLAMNPSTERPRRVELVEGKAVKDSQRRRHTSSGRLAVVWIASNLPSTQRTPLPLRSGTGPD